MYYVCCCVITVEILTPYQNHGLRSNLTCSVAFMLANRNLWKCISVQLLTLQFVLHIYLSICLLLMAVLKADMLGNVIKIMLSCTRIMEK
jgi:hypothetical protein